MRLEHPDVSLGSGKNRRGCQRRVFRIRIVVRVLVMELADRHFALRRLLTQNPMALGENLRDVSTGCVVIVVGIARVIVKIRYIVPVKHGIIKLDTRPLGLNDVQLREMLAQLLVESVLEIVRQAIGPHKPTRWGVTSSLIDAAYRQQVTQQSPVSLHIYACNTQILHIGASVVYLLPIEQCTAVDDQSRNIRRSLQREPGVAQFGQIAQFERLNRSRENGRGERRALGEGHTSQSALRSSECLEFAVGAQIDRREAG